MKSLLTLTLILLAWTAGAQGNWKLTRESEGIKVYQSDNKGFKNIKVECTLNGSFASFSRVLADVGNFHNWVYGNKQARLLRTVSADDYYYYSETAIPWPLQNRDAVVHAQLTHDAQGRWLKLTETSVSGLFPEQSGKVRVQQSAISWTVSRISDKQVHIVYLFSAEPGGSIPAWIANSFADKGPYESFKKLATLLQ